MLQSESKPREVQPCRTPDSFVDWAPFRKRTRTDWKRKCTRPKQTLIRQKRGLYGWIEEELLSEEAVSKLARGINRKPGGGEERASNARSAAMRQSWEGPKVGFSCSGRPALRQSVRFGGGGGDLARAIEASLTSDSNSKLLNIVSFENSNVQKLETRVIECLS